MRIVAKLLLLLLGLPGWASGADEIAGPAVSLAELAAKADLVALAQVKDTDYFRRREIPVSGSAYLKVLIPYRMDHAAELIEVYEKGLRDGECYFPNPTVFEEGRRYLVFLVRDTEEKSRYRGLAEGCALDVLVDDNNRYALRYPATGILLSDSLDDLAVDLKFSDPYAVVEDESLPPALRDAMLTAGQLTPYPPIDVEAKDEAANWAPVVAEPGRQWMYTKGVELTTIRELMDLTH